jgi:hypothetical protein
MGIIQLQRHSTKGCSDDMRGDQQIVTSVSTQHSQDSEEQEGRSEVALARMSRPVARMRWRRFGRSRGRRDPRTAAADELARKEGGRLAAE